MDISRKNFWILISIFVVLSILIYPISFKDRIWPDDLYLEKVPLQIGDWKSISDLPISEDFFPETRETRKVGVKALNREYTDSKGNSIWLYIGYFNYKEGPAHHNPARCFFSQGWTFIDESMEDIAVKDKNEKINKVFVQKGVTQQIALYWYQIGNNIFSDDFKHQFKLLLNNLISGRSDGVVISITSDNISGNIKNIVAFQKEFAKEIIPLIPQYIPK